MITTCPTCENKDGGSLISPVDNGCPTCYGTGRIYDDHPLFNEVVYGKKKKKNYAKLFNYEPDFKGPL